MGNNINAAVTPGYNWVKDANNQFQITDDRLNLAASPTVTVPIDEDYLPIISISVGAESSDIILVTAQVQSILSNNSSHNFVLRAWLSDTESGGETGTEPDGTVSWTTGTTLETVTAKKRWKVITNSSGAAVLSIENTTTDTWYLNIELDGRVWVSDGIAFT